MFTSSEKKPKSVAMQTFLSLYCKAYPEGAAAGAMRIQLGGTNIYFGEVVYKPTIGDKKLDLSFENINDCIKLMYAAEILMVVMYILGILMIKV